MREMRPLRPDPRFGGRPATGWASWSPRRKFRLARTGVILFVLILIVWRCSSGDDTVTTSSSTTTTPKATTTTVPKPAMTTTAAAGGDDLPSVRSLGGAAAVGDTVLIAGGLDGTRNSTAELWRFDPTTGKTAAAGKLPGPRHGAAVAGRGDTALVMGGAKGSTTFDQVLAVAADGTVNEAGKLPTKRTDAVALTDPDDGSVLVVGGWDGKDGRPEVLRTTDGSSFATVATLGHPVRFPAVAQLGRSVWVAGGELGTELSAVVQRVDLDSGQVTDVATLPVPLSRASGFALGNSIFVAGGRTPDGRSDQVYRVDALTGQVTVAGTLPAARSDAAVTVVGRTAYLLGGLSPKPVATVLAVTAS